MDLRTKMRSLYGDDVRLKLISQDRSFFRRKTGVGAFAPDFDHGFGLNGYILAEVLSVIEERLSWARFGL
jgi:hypothetical protein